MGLCWVLQRGGPTLCPQGFRVNLAPCLVPESCVDRAQPNPAHVKAQEAIVSIGIWGRTYSVPGMKSAPLWIFPATVHLMRACSAGSGSATWGRDLASLSLSVLKGKMEQSHLPPSQDSWEDE